jgi:hypothetical protein
VVVFRRDFASGGLTFVEKEQEGIGGVEGLREPKDVTISPDGGRCTSPRAWTKR